MFSGRPGLFFHVLWEFQSDFFCFCGGPGWISISYIFHTNICCELFPLYPLPCPPPAVSSNFPSPPKISPFPVSQSRHITENPSFPRRRLPSQCHLLVPHPRPILFPLSNHAPLSPVSPQYPVELSILVMLSTCLFRPLDVCIHAPLSFFLLLFNSHVLSYYP